MAAQAKPKSAHKVQKISDVEPVLASQTLVLREKVLQGELVLADDENTSETLVLRQKVSDVEPVLTTGYDSMFSIGAPGNSTAYRCASELLR